MSEFEEEQFEEVPRFDELRFDQIVKLNEAQRHWFLQGQKISIVHQPPGKVPVPFSSKIQRLPVRLVRQIFTNRTILPGRDGKLVLVLEFETDVLSLELALQYLLACVDKGKYADVETDEKWGDRILETFKVLGAEYGITRMVQSAAGALRRLQAQEQAEKAKRTAETREELQRQKADKSRYSAY